MFRPAHRERFSFVRDEENVQQGPANVRRRRSGGRWTCCCCGRRHKGIPFVNWTLQRQQHAVDSTDRTFRRLHYDVDRCLIQLRRHPQTVLTSSTRLTWFHPHRASDRLTKERRMMKNTTSLHVVGLTGSGRIDALRPNRTGGREEADLISYRRSEVFDSTRGDLTCWVE
jgi:hypothetical protein